MNDHCRIPPQCTDKIKWDLQIPPLLRLLYIGCRAGPPSSKTSLRSGGSALVVADFSDIAIHFGHKSRCILSFLKQNEHF